MQTYCKSFHSALHCASSMCYIPLVSVHFHSRVRAVSCQSNTLTLSIYNMVNSLMDVVSLGGCTLWMLLVMWSPVVCAVCIHTIHRPLSRLLYTHLLIHVTMCIYVYIYIYVQYINVHFHVSIVTTCVCSKCLYILLHLIEDVL